MSAVENGETEVVADIIGPGRRLKTLREERGIDLASVASMLHLSESKLEALESDKYESLPGSVFTQGYLRNYARVLEVPSEPLLEAYQQINPPVEPQLDLKVARVNHEVRSSHGIVRMITWVIVLGLVGLVLTWWQGYLQWPLATESVEDLTPTLEQSQEKPLGDLPLNVEPSVPTLDAGESTLVLPVTGTQQASITSDVQESVASEEEQTNTQVEASDSVDQKTIATTTDQLPDEAESATTVTSVDQPETVAPEPAKIELVFSGESWISVKDASGDFKLTGIQKRGQRRLLGGTAPYEMVLGNATVVKMLVDGEAFNLTPYVTGNVAKLTYKPN